jgi:hypothetical protein
MNAVIKVSFPQNPSPTTARYMSRPVMVVKVAMEMARTTVFSSRPQAHKSILFAAIPLLMLVG